MSARVCTSKKSKQKQEEEEEEEEEGKRSTDPYSLIQCVAIGISCPCSWRPSLTLAPLGQTCFSSSRLLHCFMAEPTMCTDDRLKCRQQRTYQSAPGKNRKESIRIHQQRLAGPWINIQQIPVSNDPPHILLQAPKAQTLLRGARFSGMRPMHRSIKVPPPSSRWRRKHM